MKPLEGITVLDFSQFLSGPSASLRLADLGAEVIKIEKTGNGDICRQLYVTNVKIDGESSIFHTINRNKDGISVDLKNDDEYNKLLPLIEKADIIIINFRPGVSKKLKLDYERIKKINPKIIYAEITGYGKEGPWKDLAGQDLLVQSISGLSYLNGNSNQPPTPFGLSVADMFAGQHLVQGILGSLVKREIKGEGSLIEVSLLESILDIQFELFTTFLNDGNELPERSSINNANAYIGAPYGIYETSDGYIALAMVPVTYLGELISCRELEEYTDPKTWSTKRDEIKSILVSHLKTETTSYWLEILEKADIWCSDVYSWDKLFETDGFKQLNMIQKIKVNSEVEIETTRCPIRIDKELYTSQKGSPKIGEHNTKYLCKERGNKNGKRNLL